MVRGGVAIIADQEAVPFRSVQSFELEQETEIPQEIAFACQHQVRSES